MSILKIEAFSGLSGDMFLSALAGLSDSYTELQSLPAKLHLSNVEVKVTEMNKAGIACRHIKIIDNNIYEKSGHSHHHHGPQHSGKFQGGESGNVQLRHEDHAHHRHLQNIEKLIDQGDISSSVKDSAKKIFHILGEAEAQVHGVDINSLHFHEVGAIDSILDIVGSAYLLDKLAINQVVATPVCTGHGFVMTEHGRMPIPAPATKELLIGIPTYAGQESGEMTTPTGAAIIKFLNPSFTMPPLVETKIAHGPGEKNFPHPNVLRLTLCEPLENSTEEITMIETNIDDMSSQLLGSDFQDRLLSAGALDFYFTQVIMKKGRPGLLISVFAPVGKVKQVSDFLLENTTTIGVRMYPVSRHILKRTLKSVKTSVGEVQVKEVETPLGHRRVTPEFESLKSIAKETGKPIAEVIAIINKEMNDLR